jgi:ubiquinone/menaquinone biosynthesis C-methylase UbiE
MKQAVAVSSTLDSLYEDYYENDEATLRKRELTAIEVFKHFRKLYPTATFDRVLDVGAGEGSLLSCLSANQVAKQLYGVEISESGVQAIEAKAIPNLVEIRKFDGYTIPYPDKFFDVAISSHVLEHVEHERLFLAELQRVAKEVVIEVPLEHTYRLNRAVRINRQYGHINFYTVDTLVNLLETSGLTVQDYQIVNLGVAFEQALYGWKGYVKGMIRQAVLRLAPSLAMRSMVYFCIVRCRGGGG